MPIIDGNVWADEPMEEELFDLEKVVPLQLIREHTKTDDVPLVSDVMLELYRDAAFEAASEYLGLDFTGRRVVDEMVKVPFRIPRDATGQYANKFQFEVSKPFAGDYCWLYGIKNRPAQQVEVVPGTRTAIASYVNIAEPFGHQLCCDPCNGGESAIKSRCVYYTGIDNIKRVPSQVKIGVLKYCAHLMFNPGDLGTVHKASGGKSNDYNLNDAANPAVASGAIEIWRVIKKDAI